MIKSILITRITRMYNNNRIERKIMYNNHNMETSSIMLNNNNNNNNKECIIIKWTTIINNSNIILSLNKIITVKTIIITIKTKIIITIKTKIIIIILIIRKWCNNKWECKQKKWQLISYYQTWYLIVKTNKEVGQYNRPSRMQLIKKKNRCLKLFISNLYN